MSYQQAMMESAALHYGQALQGRMNDNERAIKHFQQAQAWAQDNGLLPAPGGLPMPELEQILATSPAAALAYCHAFDVELHCIECGAFGVQPVSGLCLDCEDEQQVSRGAGMDT